MVHKYTLIFASYFFISSFANIFANQDKEAIFKNEFETVFNYCGIYHKGQCARNVERLINRFNLLRNQPSRAYEDFRLIRFYLPASDPSGIRWMQAYSNEFSRNFDPKWIYHVVLMHDSFIYDLDLSSKPVHASEYFHTHFLSPMREDIDISELLSAGEYRLRVLKNDRINGWVGDEISLSCFLEQENYL